MAAHHGSVGEFDASRESWTSYCERLELYFVANEVLDAAKQRAIFLTVCGPTTYQLVRNLVAPAKPTDKSLAALVKLVEDHHSPQPSVTVHRFKFNSRTQADGETIAAFVAELRRLSEHCEFGDQLDVMLRDRLVCGVRDTNVQRRLLAESKLTYKKAFDLAQAAEVATQNARDLQGPPPPASVNVMQRAGGARSHRPGPSLCYRCGDTQHRATDCRFKDAECRFCHKKGHLEKVCFAKNKQTPPARNYRGGRRNAAKQVQQTSPAGRERQHDQPHDTSSSPADDDVGAYSLFHTTGRCGPVKPMMVALNVNQAEIQMELDTGASCSIISEATYRSLWPPESAPPLKPSPIKLRTYSGEDLPVKGSISVLVQYQDQETSLPLTVVAGNGSSLLGSDWLLKLTLDWKSLCVCQVQNAAWKSLSSMLESHATLFNEELGLMKGRTAKLHVDPAVPPRFCQARTVPYALRDKVAQELDRLERLGIIEPVPYSDWAAPIVPVVKQDGTIRICGDYKVTVNKAAKVDSYPLPRVEDLLASIGHGKSFTKLDLAHAYLQIPLDEESQQYVVINTQQGLYKYNRLPFGIASASAIFQRTIEGILHGIPNISIYIDDILVTGETEANHLETLSLVLDRLEEAGLRLKKPKCEFMQESVDYLGHTISARGIQPTKEKVRAVAEAPTPKNLTQLRSFLGLVNYYGKFLPQLANTFAPLYSLLQKDTKWTWGKDQQDAFREAKQQLTSSCVLVHFDPTKELILACDASPYGIGAVLSHRLADGSDKPIAFASRSLADAEKKYSQLDKEALAIIFGVKKFHHYVYGRNFTILSDHKPLKHLFDYSRPIPAMASARIQRWALTLSAYQYDIEYKPGSAHANADLLSRLPLPDAPGKVPIPGETVLLMEALHTLPVTAAEIKRWTERDPLMSTVRKMVLQGWQPTTEEELRPFHSRRNELSVHDGCVLWGSRVVIPQAGRARVLGELHEEHPGTSRMKALARSVAWWPKMDSDIEAKVKQCHACQENQKSPAAAPLHPWDWPKRPWARIHIDHAGPFMGKIFLVVVDAHSKWLEVTPVASTSSQATIQALRRIFATHGLPEMLVSDNGTAFTSEEFRQFLKTNGVRAVNSAPYHPASNGLAERAVQTFKRALKKATPGDLERHLQQFLFRYRITPHATTGVPPADLLFGRHPRSRLDLMTPGVSATVERSQQRQQAAHDQHAKDRSFQINDQVFVRSFRGPVQWLPGMVTAINGPLSYEITLSDNRVVRRHVDHVRARTSTTDAADGDWVPDVPTDPPVIIPPPNRDPAPEFRRSTRQCSAPVRFDPSSH